MEEREIIRVFAKTNENGMGSTYRAEVKDVNGADLQFGIATILTGLSSANNVSIAQLINELKEACLSISTAPASINEVAKPSEE